MPKYLPMKLRPLDHPNKCDICGQARSTRRHAKCSKVRQARGFFAAQAAQREAARAHVNQHQEQYP